LRWHHAPDNAFGQLYLPTFRAQKSTDRKSLIYVQAGTTISDVYYGPNTYYEPGSTTVVNSDPDGDIWYDTANNNSEYIYNYTGSGERSNTIYYTAYESSGSGWYSVDNLLIGSQQRALELAAATGTDRHVQMFSAATPQTASGNGDIWVNTEYLYNLDGTANLNTIFIANTKAGDPTYTPYTSPGTSPQLYWHQEPNSGLGRSFIEQLIESRTRNYMPIGWSLFNEDPAQYANSFSNKEQSKTVLYPYYNNPSGTEFDIVDSPVSPVGGKTLRTLKYAGGYFFFPTSISGYSVGYSGPDNPRLIKIPQGRKWLLSWYAKNNYGDDGEGRDSGMYIWLANSTYHGEFAGYLGAGIPFSTTGWERHYTILDLTSGTLESSTPTHSISVNADWPAGSLRTDIDRFGLRIDPGGNQPTPGHEEYPSTVEATETFYSGFQLEDITGTNQTTPSKFVTPGVPTTEIDFTRSLTDSKTVQFVSPAYDNGTFKNSFGPDPSLTDNGITNPEPHGDKLVTTTPPYKTYIYFSNNTNKTSQTMHHSLSSYSENFKVENTRWPFGASNNISGWYEYLDVGSSLLQEGYEVQLGRVALGLATWTLGDPEDVLGRGIVVDPEDQDPTNQAPLLDLGDTSGFGQNKEILLNPVPPADANLHAHWTFNSMGVDPSGERYIPDISGRGNHARVHGFTGHQTIFQEHDPASDVINVSGNFSLYSSGGTDNTDGDNYGGIVLGAYGAGSTVTLNDGSSIPLDISDDTLYSKQTWTFWYKPDSNFGVGVSGNLVRILSQDYNSNWALIANTSTPLGTNNNEYTMLLGQKLSSDDLLDSSLSQGWFGNTVTDASTTKHGAIRLNEWHFFALTINYPDKKISLWIYREGEGLIAHVVRDLSRNTLTTTDGLAQRAVKFFENSESTDGFSSRLDRASGWLDEARLYNSILTPRNIRYLYENPTGRARQLQPRPGMAVKHGYATFEVGRWAAGVGDIKTGDNVQIYANGAAYFHGYDVDGNPADVDPYISFDGQVKYLNRGMVRIGFQSDTASARTLSLGASGYILYRDTPYEDDFDNLSQPTLSANANYVFAQPVAANSTYPETWRYQRFWSFESPLPASSRGNRGWTYFTPNDAEDLVIGEATIAGTLLGSAYSHFDTIDVYQFARKPSIVRESYNFNIKPEDFYTSSGMGNHFFANADFWTGSAGQGLINGTYIENLSVKAAAIDSVFANRIQAGTIGVSLKIGGDLKIELDGVNNRIIVRE